MTPGDRAALEALRLRLDHAQAVARLIARTDDTDTTRAVYGVVQLLTDASDDLTAILEDVPA